MENNENIIAIAAHIHTFCIGIIIVFHSLLILGKPWGHLTMAGKYPGELPPKMKIFSVVSILILTSIMLIVEISAGSLFIDIWSLGKSLIVVVVVFNLVQTILHILTPSKWERILWLPLILIMLACSSVVWWLN